MSVVLAAIDASAAAQPVLEMAHELARVMGVEVEIVHVEEPGGAAPAAGLAHTGRAVFHRRTGKVVDTITSVAKERDAVAVVIGTRGVPAGASPAGHVTMELVQTLDVAVAVVPPQAAPRPIRRVLIAVEGDGESHALLHCVRHFRRGPELELVALHVFEPDQLPPFGDQPVHFADAWTEEFGRRALRTTEHDVRVEVRVGAAAREVQKVARELDVDLAVVAWHTDLTGGHGRLVRTLLTDADVPVLLLPITAEAATERS